MLIVRGPAGDAIGGRCVGRVVFLVPEGNAYPLREVGHLGIADADALSLLRISRNTRIVKALVGFLLVAQAFALPLASSTAVILVVIIDLTMFHFFVFRFLGFLISFGMRCNFGVAKVRMLANIVVVLENGTKVDTGVS